MGQPHGLVTVAVVVQSGRKHVLHAVAVAIRVGHEIAGGGEVEIRGVVVLEAELVLFLLVVVGVGWHGRRPWQVV